MPIYEDYTAEKTELIDFRVEEKIANIKILDHMTAIEMFNELMNGLHSIFSSDKRLQRANSALSSKLYKIWAKKREEEQIAKNNKT